MTLLATQESFYSFRIHQNFNVIEIKGIVVNEGTHINT